MRRADGAIGTAENRPRHSDVHIPSKCVRGALDAVRCVSQFLASPESTASSVPAGSAEIRRSSGESRGTARVRRGKSPLLREFLRGPALHPRVMIRRAMLPSGPNRLVMALFVCSAALVFAASPQWPEAHPAVGQQPRRPAGYTPYAYPRTPEGLWRGETAALLEHSARARAAIEQTIAHGDYHATFESISTHQAPEWFLDAKFGMFVDWGPWSVAGWAPQAEKATYPDWYEQKLFKEYRDYHEKTWGADIRPDDLIQLLDGGHFDPAALASLAKAAGMQYSRAIPQASRWLLSVGFVLHASRRHGVGSQARSRVRARQRLSQGRPPLRCVCLAQRVGLSHRPRQYTVADVVLGSRDRAARPGDTVSVRQGAGSRLRPRLSRAVADGIDRPDHARHLVVRR